MKKRRMLLFVLLFLLGISVIGYAVLSETINISGTASASGDFDVEFYQVGEIVESGSQNAEATISSDKNTLTIKVPMLEYPGAYAEIPVTVRNNGTISAKLESVEADGLEEASRAVKITYSGEASEEQTVIDSQGTANMSIRIEWDSEVNAPASDVSFTIRLNYIQAN